MKKTFGVLGGMILVIGIGGFVLVKVVTHPNNAQIEPVTDPVEQDVILPEPVTKNITSTKATGEITIAYPFFNTPAVDALIEQKIQTIQSSFIEFTDQTDPLMSAGVPFLEVGSTVKRSGGVVSVIIKGAEYTGGAHPNPFVTTLVFKGTQLQTLDNYFTVPSTEYLARFQFIARKALIDKYGAESLFLEGLDPTPENWSNWYVVDNAFIVIFSPYQVGPYVIGMPEVVIPFSQVQDILQQ